MDKKQTFNRKNKKEAVMLLAWQFVKRNNFRMREALKLAWANIKLINEMEEGVVKFRFQKCDGTIRTAYGTLTQNSYYASNVHSEISSQIFFDTVKRELRSFRKANLIG